MKTTRANKLAKAINLQVVDVTEGANGYPRNIEAALTGFSSFKDAEKFAESHNLTAVQLHRRFGWNFYESQGQMVAPMEPDYTWYGDDYEVVDKETKDDFDSTTEAMLQGVDEEDEAFITAQRSELWKMMQELQDGEVLVLCNGEHYETIKKRPTSWSFDGHEYIVAVL